MKGLLKFILGLAIFCGIIFLALNILTFNMINMGDQVIPVFEQTPNDLGIADRSFWSIIKTFSNAMPNDSNGKGIIDEDSAPTTEAYESLDGSVGTIEVVESSSDTEPTKLSYSTLLTDTVYTAEPVDVELSNSELTALVNSIFGTDEAKIASVSSENFIKLSNDRHALDEVDTSLSDSLSSFGLRFESITPAVNGNEKTLKIVLSLQIPTEVLDQLMSYFKDNNINLPKFITKIFENRIYISCLSAVEVSDGKITAVDSSLNSILINSLNTEDTAMITSLLKDLVPVDLATLPVEGINLLSQPLYNLGFVDEASFGSGVLKITTRTKN